MAGKKNKKGGKGAAMPKQKPQQSAQVSRQQQSGATTRAVVSNATPGFSASLKNSTKIVSGENGNLTLTGSELLGITSGTPSGDICFLFDLAPIQWTGCRASTFARMYESFKIKRLRITVIPTCPNTSSGLTFIYVDRDPLDAPVGNILTSTNVSRLMSASNASAGTVWKPLTNEYRSGKSEMNSYFNQPVLDEGDLRQTQQGIAYIYTTSAVSGGLVKVDYEIDFMTPTPLGLAIAPQVPWALGSVSTTATTSGTTPLAINSFSGSGNFQVVYEFLLDAAISVTINSVITVLNAYTPIYFRYSANTTATNRLYFDLNSAINQAPDGVLYGAPGNTAVNSAYAWIKVAYNMLAAQNT